MAARRCGTSAWGGGTKSIVFAQDRIRLTVEREGEISSGCRCSTPDVWLVIECTEDCAEQDKTPVPGKTFSVVERITGNR